MAHKVVMPQLGITTTEGTIVRWYKQIGDMVKKGEALFEVTTDKVNTDVEATAEGVLLAVLYKEGDTVSVTKVVAVIGNPGEKIDDFLSEAIQEEAGILAMAQGGLKEKPGPETEGGAFVPVLDGLSAREPQKLSPVARNLAREHGLAESELALIKGTGPGGIVGKRDILLFLEKKASKWEDAAAPPISCQSKSEFPVKEPISSIRKVVATRMLKSWQEIPQFSLRMDLDASFIVRKQQELNRRIQARPGSVKLSINDFLIKAVAMAVEEFPSINAVFSWDGVIMRGEINVGLAVALNDGLIVPVLKKVNRVNLAEIAVLRNEIVERARGGKLTADDLSNGSITISNLGTYDIDSFTAIINPPEACILAVGKIRERIVMNEKGEVGKNSYLTIVGSFDHRLIDGAQGARFMQIFKDHLEGISRVFCV